MPGVSSIMRLSHGPWVGMSSFQQTDIGDDLSRIALRVVSEGTLDAEFCDRLTRLLAQLFSHADAGCSDAERSVFDDIFVKLTPIATVDTRLYLSDRLATSPTPPRTILLLLAYDAVEVARPILERSTALSDDDLIDIARTRGHGHMEAIAERRELSIRVTDVLVLRGDDLVRRIIAGNGGAVLSDKSFARLSLQARADRTCETRLVGRDDLPDVVIHFLAENGSPEIHEALVARIRAHERRDLASGSMPIRRAEDGWLEPYDFDEAAGVLARFNEVRAHLDGFVRKLAETDHFPEIVQILAAASEVPLDTMKHVLVGLDTEPFVVIARSIGLKADTVREVLAVGPWLHRLDARARIRALEAFGVLGQDEARDRLRRWLAPSRAGRAR